MDKGLFSFLLYLFYKGSWKRKSTTVRVSQLMESSFQPEECMSDGGIPIESDRTRFSLESPPSSEVSLNIYQFSEYVDSMLVNAVHVYACR